MTPATFNFPAQYPGDTFDAMPIVLTDTSTGAAIDLTGAAVELAFSLKGVPAFSSSVGSGITLTDPAAGALSIDAFQVPTVAGIYAYHLTITTAGAAWTPLKGVLQVTL